MTGVLFDEYGRAIPIRNITMIGKVYEDTEWQDCYKPFSLFGKEFRITTHEEKVSLGYCYDVWSGGQRTTVRDADEQSVVESRNYLIGFIGGEK